MRVDISLSEAVFIAQRVSFENIRRVMWLTEERNSVPFVCTTALGRVQGILHAAESFLPFQTAFLCRLVGPPKSMSTLRTALLTSPFATCE